MLISIDDFLSDTDCFREEGLLLCSELFSEILSLFYFTNLIIYLIIKVFNLFFGLI